MSQMVTEFINEQISSRIHRIRIFCFDMPAMFSIRHSILILGHSSTTCFAVRFTSHVHADEKTLRNPIFVAYDYMLVDLDLVSLNRLMKVEPFGGCLMFEGSADQGTVFLTQDFFQQFAMVFMDNWVIKIKSL